MQSWFIRHCTFFVQYNKNIGLMRMCKSLQCPSLALFSRWASRRFLLNSGSFFHTFSPSKEPKPSSLDSSVEELRVNCLHLPPALTLLQTRDELHLWCHASVYSNCSPPVRQGNDPVPNHNKDDRVDSAGKPSYSLACRALRARLSLMLYNICRLAWPLVQYSVST